MGAKAMQYLTSGHYQTHMRSPRCFASHMAQATFSTAMRSHLVHVLNREVPFILNIKVLKKGTAHPLRCAYRKVNGF
jgi:hypothetical protein